MALVIGLVTEQPAAGWWRRSTWPSSSSQTSGGGTGSMMSDPAVLLSVDACVARLVLNRAATGNAMDPVARGGPPRAHAGDRAARRRSRGRGRRDRQGVLRRRRSPLLRDPGRRGAGGRACAGDRPPRCHRVPRPPGGAGHRGGQRSGRGRRAEPRLRRRHRDCGSLGDLHVGLHGRRPLARRWEYLVPPPPGRHPPCGGADAHQPSARCSECGGCRHRDPCRGRRGARVGGRARRFAARCGANACARSSEATAPRLRHRDAGRAAGRRGYDDCRARGQPRRTRGRGCVPRQAPSERSRAAELRVPASTRMSRTSALHA